MADHFSKHVGKQTPQRGRTIRRRGPPGQGDIDRLLRTVRKPKPRVRRRPSTRRR